MRLIFLFFFLSIAQLKASSAPFRWCDTSAPSWMRDAVIYGIKPSGFVENSTYDHITDKLSEIKELGINTIWLQPVFKTKLGGQGYDVIDFFSLREDLGSASQLKNLINKAHGLNIRVLFDFVPNHTSIEHPYAKDIILHRDASVYYDYYQHEFDNAPYSSFYHRDSSGFIYYFWKNLVNLNYNNEEVRNMIIDACVYWVKEFDIDGYRFDAVWAVNARAPEFGKKLRTALKAVKPDILMLAEDKGWDENVYSKGFDAAYDWTNDTAWVSHWSWQYEYHPKKNFTIFNHPTLSKRYSLLKQSIFTNKNDNHRILRFMENNDIARFISSHSLQQTKMAASLLFALPGIPLIFTGQEVGNKNHPYSRRPVFSADLKIKQKDSFGLFDHYKNLIAGRLKYRSLTSSNISEIEVKNAEAVLAFHRWENNEHFIIIINLDSTQKDAEMNLEKQGLGKIVNRKTVVYDVFSGAGFYPDNKRHRLRIKVEGYSVRWLRVEKSAAKGER